MITEIDWRYWRVMPEVTQWEACALSLNVNPEKMRHHPDAWMNGPGAPIFTNAGFRSTEISEEFKKRRRLLEASVFTSGFFPTVRGLVMGARWKATIRLDEFVTWLTHVGLDMPPELCALHEPASKPHVTPASEPVTPVAAPTLPPAETLASTTQASPESSPLMSASEPAVKGLTTAQIVEAFDGLVNFGLGKAMTDRALWTCDARITSGTKGGRHKSLWCPVIMATALHERNSVPMPKLNKAFNTCNFLADWRDEWNRLSTM